MLVVGLAPSGLAVDRRLVATVASIATVGGRVLPREPRLHPAQSGSRAGEVLTSVRRVAEAAVTLVLPALALVLASLAFVGSKVAPVRIVFAAVGETVPPVGGGVAKIRRRVGGGRTVGDATLTLGVPLHDLGGVLVPAQRPPVQLGGLAMEIDQRGLGRLGHEALAAFRGITLAARELARAVAVELRPPRQHAMIVGAIGGHPPDGTPNGPHPGPLV